MVAMRSQLQLYFSSIGVVEDVSKPLLHSTICCKADGIRQFKIEWLEIKFSMESFANPCSIPKPFNCPKQIHMPPIRWMEPLGNEPYFCRCLIGQQADAL